VTDCWKIVAGGLGASLGVVALIYLAAVLIPPPVPRDAPPPFAGLSGEFSVFDSPKPVPDLAFTDAEGGDAVGATIGRKAVLLNVWATWCGPCVVEMPTLDRLQAELGGPDFEVVAVSLDRDGAATVRPFLAAHGLNDLAIYLGSFQGLAPLNIPGLPATYLFDRRGRLVGSLRGPAEWDSDAAQALIRFYTERP
jgi:thiol-disulfide isomerase/thioredoxin